MSLAELEAKVKEISKKYDVVVERADTIDDPCTTIPTGSPKIDLALGGGLPSGKLIEIYGPPDVGKSTLAFSIMSQAAKMGFLCAYMDVERSWDPAYVESIIGKENLTSIYRMHGKTSEEVIDATELLILTGQFKVVVIDSIPALVPRSQAESDLGTGRQGARAALLSLALPKLITAADDNDTMVLLINQFRTKLGRITYLEPTGGWAMRHYPCVRLALSKTDGKPKDTESNYITVEVIRSKYKANKALVETSIVRGMGYDHAADTIDIASDYGIITRSGTWYAYGDTKIGQGMEKAKAFLLDNPEIYSKIWESIRDVG